MRKSGKVTIIEGPFTFIQRLVCFPSAHFVSFSFCEILNLDCEPEVKCISGDVIFWREVERARADVREP